MATAARRAPRSRLGSDTVTDGIRVRVTPAFLGDHSDPATRQFVFGYRIKITNQGANAAKLLARHWVVIDGHGRRRDIEGDGVIGQQPRLEPGQTFEYASQCPLATTWGTMEGTYRMTRDDGKEFDAGIGRFFLVAEER